jgi:hypothetical protein
VREVAVQVDAVRIAARSRPVSVRVCVRDEPEVDALERPEAPQPVHNGDPGALVPVEAADDENLARGGGIADLVGDDPAALNRVADEMRRGRNRGDGEQGGQPHQRVSSRLA